MPAKPQSPSRDKAASPPATAAANVVLITGAEAGRKQSAADALLREHAAADWADFDAETLDGDTALAERILSGVATVPLGEGKRAVLVRDTQQMDPEEQRKLAAGLSRIPPSGFLILHTGTPIVEDGKTKRASVVVAELASAVKKAGRVEEFGLPREADVREWAVREARALGKTLAPDALQVLAQLSGEDLYRVGNELAKAAAHAGDAPQIARADVEATLSRGPDDVIFKLCDAVGMRRRDEALAHVATLFRGGGRPDAVAPRALVLLARQIRLLTQFKYLAGKGLAGRGAGAVPPDVAALLPADGAAATLSNPRTAWMAERYLSQARNFSGTELLERMERLLQADLALKGIAAGPSGAGGEAPQSILQRLVIELC
jgi:DNA polymerase III delta subunit